jgi:hypothetical protein
MVFKRHFQQYFSYIVAVSFIDGENQSTLTKPPTCNKSVLLMEETGVHREIHRPAASH